MRIFSYLFVCLLGLLISSCRNAPKIEGDFPDHRPDWRNYQKFGGVTDKDGITLLGGESKGNSQFPVNRYLWMAALETLNFMPFSKISPSEGILQTEWNNLTESSYEQFQVMVHITGEHLLSHLLNIAVHRRIKGKNGEWLNVEVHPEVILKLKNAILNKAREFKSNRSFD